MGGENHQPSRQSAFGCCAETRAAAARRRRYGDNFKGFYITQHQIKAGEIAGKSSNENWAVRCMKRCAAQSTAPRPPVTKCLGAAWWSACGAPY